MDINELLNQNELHMAQVLGARLDELGIPTNVLRILKGREIRTLKDLCSLSRDDLLSIRFIGSANVDEIERILAKFDLRLRQ